MTSLMLQYLLLSVGEFELESVIDPGSETKHHESLVEIAKGNTSTVKQLIFACNICWYMGQTEMTKLNSSQFMLPEITLYKTSLS